MAAQLLQDGEISYAIVQETGLTPSDDSVTQGTAQLYSSAARCCEVLARNFAMQADTEVGQMKVTYSRTAQNYAAQATALRTRAAGYNAPYSGGQSIGEKEGWRQDTDLPRPKFTRDQFDSPYVVRGDDNGALPPMPN